MERRTSIVILIALICAAMAPLFFREFVTVDGPKHLLHVAIFESQWSGDRFAIEGMRYDTSRLSVHAGDLLLIMLTGILGPAEAIRAFAALTSVALLLSMLMLVRSFSVQLNSAMLWTIVPLFNFLLVMGFLNFHLGIALCFFTLAIWRDERIALRWRAVLVALALLISWRVHRGAPMLLIALCAIDLAFRTLSVKETRRHMRSALIVLGTVGALIAVAVLIREAQRGVDLPPSSIADPYDPFLLFRPLLLMDSAKEGPVLVMVGSLFVAAIALGLRARWSLGAVVRADDALLVMTAALFSLSLTVRGSESKALFLAERCQWLALLIISVWLVVMVAHSTERIQRFQQVLVLMMIPLQGVRWAHAEGAMAELRVPRALVREAADALIPGGLVVVGMAEPNWLLVNLPAELAIRYDGVLVPGPHLRTQAFGAFVPSRLRYRLWELTNDPGALAAHWRSRQLPRVEHVVILGNDTALRDKWLSQWAPVLDTSYRKVFDNGYAVVWSAIDTG